MSRAKRIGIAEAFDMVPMGGFIIAHCDVEKAMSETDRRNELRNGNWYSVAICLDKNGVPSAVMIARKERWECASDERLLGLIHYVQRYVI